MAGGVPGAGATGAAAGAAGAGAAGAGAAGGGFAGAGGSAFCAKAEPATSRTHEVSGSGRKRMGIVGVQGLSERAAQRGIRQRGVRGRATFRTLPRGEQGPSNPRLSSARREQARGGRVDSAQRSMGVIMAVLRRSARRTSDESTTGMGVESVRAMFANSRASGQIGPGATPSASHSASPNSIAVP